MAPAATGTGLEPRPHADSHAKANPDPDARGDADRYAQPDAVTQANPDSHAGHYTDSCARPDPHPHARADAVTDAQRDPVTQANADPYARPHADSQADAHSQPDSGSHTVSQADPDPAADADAASDSDRDPDPNPEPRLLCDLDRPGPREGRQGDRRGSRNDQRHHARSERPLVVIQDSTAAVEIRLPVAGSSGAAGLAGHVPGVGTSLRVTGTIGRAYGAPRLTVASVTWLGTVTPPLPQRITNAPGAALEWRLVQVNGRLDTVHKLGDRWRTEIIVGSSRIPIAGLAGSKITVGRLFAGRQVAIIGIVRRAFPTALDQRFAIEPRSVSDLAFVAAGPVRPAPTGKASGSGAQSVDTGYGRGVAPTGTGAPAGSTTPAGPLVDLRNLASYRGRVVEVPYWRRPSRARRSASTTARPPVAWS